MIQGARQTGKSFLAREILTKLLKHSVYVILDSKLQKTFAQENPESFLEKNKEVGSLLTD